MLNQAQVIGYLGKDPELRYTPSGEAAATFSVATSEKWNDKSTGEQREKTEWHKFVMYGKLAELAGRLLQKGTLVYVSGKIETRKWTDKQGIERYTTEIKANEFKLLANGKSKGVDDGEPRQQHRAAAQSQPEAGFDDDIPF
jgi:single-strand DNA-binding protein